MGDSPHKPQVGDVVIADEWEPGLERHPDATNIALHTGLFETEIWRRASVPQAPPEDALAKLLDVRGIARAYGISEKTVRRAIERGDLPATRFGRAIRIHPLDAEEWRQRNRLAPSPLSVMPDLAPVGRAVPSRGTLAALREIERQST
jgi:excisionase family DNA binding protein